MVVQIRENQGAVQYRKTWRDCGVKWIVHDLSVSIRCHFHSCAMCMNMPSPVFSIFLVLHGPLVATQRLQKYTKIKMWPAWTQSIHIPYIICQRCAAIFVVLLLFRCMPMRMDFVFLNRNEFRARSFSRRSFTMVVDGRVFMRNHKSSHDQIKRKYEWK